MRVTRAYLLLGYLAIVSVLPAHAQTLTDALYNSHHPRLLFTVAELPALEAKLSDGGVDDATYLRVRDVVQDTYPLLSYGNILGFWYGDQAIPCIGLVGHLEQDGDALALGKALTLHIANAYNPDNDEAYSGMRLRALALGYDLFFTNATPVERAVVRDEIVLYVQKMAWTPGYRNFEYQPYLGNHSAMFGAPLGLAAIALQGEGPDYLLEDAMEMTDRIVDNLLRYEFDPDGAYNEGVFYAAWTLKQLVYYLDARHRFDGRTYADNPQFGAIDEWFAYELAPAGNGRSHNLNDSPMLSAPLGQHPTYFNWAMAASNSGLAAWLWQHTAGPLGTGVGGESDWAGTILWHKPLTATDPAAVLPASRVWEQRGLYYFRDGWTDPNDVVFNFYSGKFQGGHAQEDQNQFALTAYGTLFAIDHGAGSIAKESESHNMVFIDGQGQHNAGSSIGTDGDISDFLLGAFADIVTGDATSAYGTYSEFNAPNVPYPGANWSWGYHGANPVQHALRHAVVVHGPQTSPYMLIIDDIDKDGASHAYEWRLHTASTNAVSTAANPVVIDGVGATMDLHLLSPDFSAVSMATSAYNAGNTDPASTLLRVSCTAVNPRFTFLMIPRADGGSMPAVSRQAFTWGCGAEIDWGAGVSDVLVRNHSGSPVTFEDVTTDALVAVVRKQGNSVRSYLMAQGTLLAIDATTYVTFNDGIGSCEFADDTVELNREDADFRILDTGVERVRYREQDVGFAVDDGYVVPDGVTPVRPGVLDPGLVVSARPNPFNPSTVIHIDGVRNERASVTIYDVAGRRVRELWSGLVPGERAVTWDGRNDAGVGVASGSYFVRVATPLQTRTLKLMLVK